jgi:signal transduction histidine kinase
MAEGQLEHIFERFTRGDAGLTQHVGGTGLGLAISKSLVELHGGTIEARSALGRGSTFLIRLPVSPASANGAPDGPSGRAVGDISVQRKGEAL